MADVRKHVVGVVGNDIVADSRVKKAAAAAAVAGFESTILCYTPDSTGSTSEMGNVTVVREPVDFKAHVKNGRVPAALRPFNGSELAARHARPRTYPQARRQRVEARAIEYQTLSTRASLLWAKISMRARHDTFRVRRKGHVLFDKLGRRFNLTRKRIGLRLLRPFRDGVPNIADYEKAFVPKLVELRPDVIHANDFHMIGAAVTAARILRGEGHETRVVYDAHELIEGLDYPKRMVQGWLKLEKTFIGDVDAVIGISPEQLDRIAERHHLDSLPTVVLNAPVADSGHADGPDIRSEIGTSGSILLYHGNVTPERGLSTLVDALEFLPVDSHVVVVAPPGNPLVQEAVSRAEVIGAADRLHIRDFVPADQLLHYISTADVAVIPYLSTGNTEIALPNKLFEAIQAGLPVIASNMRSLSRLVTEFGIGEVFEAGVPSDLAKKAQLVFDGPERYAIDAGTKRNLSWDAQAEKLVDVYVQLLGEDMPATLHIETGQITEGFDGAAREERRPTRLAIGPRNMAGQAYLIAAAVQASLGVPSISFSMEKQGTFQFPVHRQISGEDWHDPRWQASQRESLADGFTHVIAESGTGILGSLNCGFIDDQLDMLQGDGLRVAVLLHGSEIRNPTRHRSLPYSPYAIDDDLTRTLERTTSRLRRHLDRIDLPIYVTTPDLVNDIEATWLPVVVDMAVWGDIKEAAQGPKPKILHLPSSSRLKGSEHVDRAVRELERQGRVEYLRPDGPLRSREVRSLVEQADIVIDQLTIGAYGLMSCQSMAAGRVTVANTRDIGSLRATCPIVDADPGNLGSVLVELLDNPHTWTQSGRAGRDFVQKYHDGRFTARTLRPFLDLD